MSNRFVTVFIKDLFILVNKNTIVHISLGPFNSINKTTSDLKKALVNVEMLLNVLIEMYNVSKCCKALQRFNMKSIRAQNKTLFFYVVFKWWAFYTTVQLQTLTTRCFPHHWSVRIEGCIIHHQTDTSWGELWYFSSLSLKWRVCFRQIQTLICLPPLLSVLTVQSCRLNDINQAKSESGVLMKHSLWTLTRSAQMLRWCRCLVCVVEQRFVFMDSLNCSVFTISAWDCARIVMLSFSSTVLCCITFSRYYRPSLVILVYYTL